MQKITQENEFFRKNSATARFLQRLLRRLLLFFIVDFRKERGAQGCEPVRFFLYAKKAFLQDVNCKTLQNYAKKSKKMQENLHISKKSIIFATDFGREPKRTQKS